jgi:hypothetical protein
MIRLPPHTDAWFTALKMFNPLQAGHTRLIVECAGTTECCSICGDTPALDYEVTGKAIEATAVVTYRLCNDCLEIQAAWQRGDGRTFKPFPRRRS